MRCSALSTAVMLCLLLSTTAVLADTIEVPSKHFSLTLPSGWADMTEEGSTYDLQLVGSSGVVCYVDSDIWLGGESFEELNEVMEETITELRNQGYPVTIISATENITVNGVSGIVTTITLTISGDTVNERMVIFVSEDWHMTWVLIFAADEPEFSQADNDMDAIVNSFTVEEKEGDSSTFSKLVYILVGITAAIVVAIVVVVVYLFKKKPTQVAPMPGPPASQAEVPPPPQPPPSQ